MARGRFVSKEVCIDKKVNELKDPWSMLGFTWLITHADVEGRTYGDPELVKSMIFPRQREISVEDVERFIQQWVDAGMIDWYEVDGEMFIQFLNFEKHQVGIRRDKEPASCIPENPMAENVRNNGGTMAENVRNDGGKSPPEVKEEVKVKVKPEVEVDVSRKRDDDNNLVTQEPFVSMFVDITGIPAPVGLPKIFEQWEKALGELRLSGVTEPIMRQAVEEMTAKKYKIVGPWSLRRPCEVILAEKKREQIPKADRQRDSEGKFADFINY